jgi:hypothetical protein
MRAHNKTKPAVRKALICTLGVAILVLENTFGHGIARFFVKTSFKIPQLCFDLHTFFTGVLHTFCYYEALISDRSSVLVTISVSKMASSGN